VVCPGARAGSRQACAHVLKRLNISSYFLQHMVAQSVNFFQY